MIEKIDIDDYQRLIEDLEEAYNNLHLFTKNEVKIIELSGVATLNYDKLKSLAKKVKTCADDLEKIRKLK